MSVDPQMSDPQKSSGNTKRTTQAKYRNCAFTWNNPDDVQRITAKLHAWRGVTYCVFGVERGELGTQHLQGYVEFKDKKLFGTVQKQLEYSHFEPRWSTAAAAANYCKKGEQSKAEWKTYQEEGPHWGMNAVVEEWGEISAQGARMDLTPACEMIQGNAPLRRVAEEHPETFVKFHKGLLALKHILIEPRDEVPEVRVYYGTTGSGKSYLARRWLGDYKADEAPWVWHPQCEKWFDGYEGEKKVIFEEFRGQIPFGMLLSLTDRYDCKVQYKGGMTEFAANKICFTSPVHPKYWYKLEDMQAGDKLDQLMRRITSIVNADEQKHKRDFIEAFAS